MDGENKENLIKDANISKNTQNFWIFRTYSKNKLKILLDKF